MYTCGPTIWNYPHIGNYRTFLFEDLLRRFLKYKGYKVTHVMNLTDVDDRIIKTVNENHEDLFQFTEKYAKSFFDDLDFLCMERAEFYPRATQHIPEMERIIEKLLATGFAYRGEDGSIYYRLSRFPSYGKLSGLELTELKSGARVRQDDYTKDSAQDFALWKAWDESDGKIFWESSSLGKGRPGWHIECSAMSMKYLGEEFDIHTGGVDNIFPHHENEIAQSEAYTSKKFVRYWLHSEHLLINDEKMSKRLGNFVTITQLRDRGIEGTSIRFAMLSGHYRAQLNFTDNSLEQAASSVRRIREFNDRLIDALNSITQADGQEDDQARSLLQETRQKYDEALSHDLDTPQALAHVFDFVSAGNRLLDRQTIGKKGVQTLLDFLTQDFEPIFAVLPNVRESEGALPANVKETLDQREVARAAKNWKLADELRVKLLEEGFEVQDTPTGQKWRRRLRAK